LYIQNGTVTVPVHIALQEIVKSDIESNACRQGLTVDISLLDKAISLLDKIQRLLVNRPTNVRKSQLASA
jgi:hypothetical protein